MTDDTVTVGGVDVPAVGLGTWRLRGDDCRRAVETALDLGYRHVDTAQAYGNERAVGAGIRESDVDREDVFLATKLDGDSRRRETVQRSVRESLDRLGTDYLDLLLIHWPNGRPPFVPVRLPGRPPLAETLEAMNELVDEGLVRHIGVSNFDIRLLDRARRQSDAPIFANQVQFHPYWDQRRLLSYCRRHDVLLTAYSPLCHGGVLDDDVLVGIGRRYDKTAAQVAIRWAIQHDGVGAIPKATSRDHLAANLDVFDFELTESEMTRIRRPSKLRTFGGFARSRLPV
ncbi:aldo/keto reductase [Haloplanus aerogenes]|uniref:Aldo/keto reductase n=1 Tax=Haloplanus aerogenes TaxID=660522 RepID=A0A3M0DPR5_9EURY|nr:aldo/keto reductase [Haloplanus aerogenes]AZH24553.1 aldo/keto reductase [Haloplanus aerogenes]RMB23791.1 diketogulonate reductase-like aldo/keto reductase [Haloplanus aerogenes]